jgi:peptidyl-prolyl cis-trans isomerase SurA
VDRIVAIVNDDIITFSELERFRKAFYRHEADKKDWLDRELNLSELRHQALKNLIEDQLLDQEATRQRVFVNQKEVDEAVESLRVERGLSQDQFEIALEREGLTYERYGEEVKNSLKKRKLMNQVVKSEIEITDENLQNYYETHINKYMLDESIRISHILLSLSPCATEEKEEQTYQTANTILREVKEGRDFEALALEYSGTLPGVRGGDLGYFKRGEMIAPLEESAFTLDTGEVSGGIRTPEGVILIKVTDKKGGRAAPFNDVRKKVERDYFRNEVDRRYQEWMKNLKERSFIEVKL